MEILWWLAPPVVATVLAMLWVSWLGRSARGEIDREAAVRRLGEAMARPTRVSSRAKPVRAPTPRERSSGVAVRRSGPSPVSGPAAAPAQSSAATESAQSTRRAS